MKRYNSIKQLVIDETISHGKIPSFEVLTRLVLEYFPNSKWKESHYNWYRSQIKTGKIELTELAERSELPESETGEDQSVTEFAVSIEKDLQVYLSNRLTDIEEGLTLVSREYKTEAGLIDLLCKDKNGDYLIIETKAGVGKDGALGQLLGYIGALKDTGIRENIRGMLVASGFEQRVVYACKVLGNVTLVKYNLSFKFEKIAKETN